MPNTNAEYGITDNYLLPIDESEYTRLNIQHTYIKTTVYEGRLVFDESVKLSLNSTLLDSGTGTGVWILDLANNVPSSVQLFGSDVSTSDFPESYPKNVHFFEASSTEFAEEWTGKFDFVNQRLLSTTLLKEEGIKSAGPAVIKVGLMDEDGFARMLAGIEDELAKIEGTQMAYRMVCAR